MTALWWAAGEEIEFPVKAANVQTTVSTNYYDSARRTPYTRGALNTGNLSPAGQILCESVPITPVTTLWLSCQFLVGGASSNVPEVGLARSGTALGGIYVGKDTPNYQRLALFKVDTSGTVTKLAAETGNSWSSNVRHRLDMQVSAFGGSATINVYLEGNPTATLSWTGSLSGLGFTDLDILRVLSNGSNGVGGIAEVILADEDTRTFVGVCSIAPDGAGTTNTFSSGTYADVDEVSLSDTDMVSSSTAAQEFDCTLSDLPSLATFYVRGVKIAVRASKGASGPSQLGVGIKHSGTANVVNKALTTSLQTYDRPMITNPVTSAAWTVADVNALQACLTSVT